MAAVITAAALAPSTAVAQYLTRAHIPWRTISTEHFDIHFPAELEEWTESVAGRLESVAAAVNRVVGNQPASRVRVMVEDPSNVSNGFALPFLGGPVIFLYPTPPSPSPTLGDHRGWGEILAVHEYAHVAHLTFPSRNDRDRLLWRLLPEQLSPVTRKAPSWVIEGYATLIEGVLTGSGRPNSVGRAAVIRQWALEGKFPTYGQLDAAVAYLGGNMRYLVGSAYLEWLQERKGDSSFVHLWRRMSARQDRSFEEAFAGVFGASPADLYGAFAVDVMQKALQVRDRLRADGLVEGELVQRLVGATGDPAVAPDGERIAIVVRRLSGPSRLVVWNTAPPDDSLVQRARQRMLERDTLDVAPFDSFPRPRRALATLHPANGRSHEHPRWLPDGGRILVSRDERTPDGVMRPDLFIWTPANGSLSRITHGASIRQADPAPDGARAAGVRCHAGTCSIVVVDLGSGSWRELVSGSPDTVWHRPRWSPDGSRIAASFQARGEWRLAVVDAESGAVRSLDGVTDGSRHSPAWAPDGSALVTVSERGGVANLALVPVDGSPGRMLTRVVGSVAGPEVSSTDSSVFFLALRSGGLDLRRIASIAPGLATPVTTLGAALAPLAPPATPVGGVFPVQETNPPRDYGAGPRLWRVLPGASFSPDGASATLMVANVDPISRLSVVGQASYGETGTWRGASVWAAWRGLPVAIEPSGWNLEQEPSEGEGGFPAPSSVDLRYRGAGLMARFGREAGLVGWGLSVGATSGQVRTSQLDDAARRMASGEARLRLTIGIGRMTANVAGVLHVAGGTTAGESFTRIVGRGAVTLGPARRFLRGDWRHGTVTEAAPDQAGVAAEAFVVGGVLPPVDPVFVAQRISLPAVPTGYATGHRVTMYRASIGGGTWQPYFIWLAAGDSPDGFQRIAGVEQEFSVRSLGFVALPAVQMRLGAGYSFDEPFKYRTRGYLSVSYSP
jgi:Tol biopolymer transport system component